MSFESPQTPANPSRPLVASGGVLIAGGGFVGSHVAREVGAATIVNPTVPSWTISPDSELVLGTAESVDPEQRLVDVASDTGLLRIAYAELVLALGRVPLMSSLARRLPIDDRGRLVVDETMRVIGAAHIWALGGCAVAASGGLPVAGESATCAQTARHARKLARSLRGEAEGR